MPSDNRDIFDKALEIAPPVVGAALGAAVARRIYNKKVWQSPARKEFHRKRKNLVTVSGAGAGYAAGDFPRQNRRK